MKIHKEGSFIIITTALVAITICFLSLSYGGFWSWLGVLALLFTLFTVAFFRVPERIMPQKRDDIVYSPADGKIVVIKEVDESEYLKCRVIQVSIFMSVTNVHVNWFPVSGNVIYYKHHQGKYLVALHEKSSELNERTTTVVDTGSHRVLFRQIAGFIARRIVNHTKVGDKAEQLTECGMIKFGSRVDLFLPLGTKIDVKIGENVRATQTIIGQLK